VQQVEVGEVVIDFHLVLIPGWTPRYLAMFFGMGFKTDLQISYPNF
jgi:hypothetical protein